MKNGKQYDGVNGKIFYDLQSVVIDASQEIVKMSIDDNLEYGWLTYKIETKDDKGKKVTVYGYTPIIQSAETSAVIALNKITTEIGNGNYIPLGSVIVATNHSHGREEPGTIGSEFFSDSDFGNVTKDKSITVVTPSGKVYEYNHKKNINYYGTVDVTKSINSDNFDVKTEKFINKDVKLDSDRIPIRGSDGNYLKIEVEYEKVIVTPKNKK